MAWLNPIIPFDEVNCMEFKSSYLAGIADTLYSSGAFETSTGDTVHVEGGISKIIGDDHVELRVDNTGASSYISVWVDGINVNYIYSGSRMTDFKVVMAINESDSGASYIGLYSTQYNQVQIKWYNAGITSYLQTYLIPPEGQEIPVIYTDKVNYMSIQSYGSDKCNLRFYLNGNCIYTLSQISTNAYLSMLVDEEQEVAKPSIIYESSSTYSYNQEDPTDTEMANLYKWLTANVNMSDFEGFTEITESWTWIEELPIRKGDNDGISFTEEVIITKVT